MSVAACKREGQLQAGGRGSCQAKVAFSDLGLTHCLADRYKRAPQSALRVLQGTPALE